ncbi:MAG: hypothetical protein MK211_11230 [Flavobacteriales bacterium]|jgi:hypothetical protein|nr:hypothetical protein [Flavobacteriales bacterium]
MKNLKTLSFLLFLSVLILSCSKNDDDDGSAGGEAEFTAMIDGGTFNNYTSELGSYSATSTNGLTIAVTDSNLNIVRLFMNATGGFSTGVVKEIGNVDGNGFATTVIIRDQDAQITYNASSGSITITSLRNGDGDNFKLINGNFNVTATTNTGETVTMTGNFKNIEYLD